MGRLIPLNYRSNEDRLTQKRVEIIIRYVIYCYQKMVSEVKTYKKSEFLNQEKTRYNLEEGLSTKLVDDFLGIWDNLQHFKHNISDKPETQLYFNCESKQTYNENDTTKDDYIDIKIQDTELTNIWGKAGEQQQVHFAIECKVIENGYSEYVTDIKKMCDRSFNTTRLPFKGQIAYITNPNYNHSTVFQGINKGLSNNKNIQTQENLKYQNITPDFEASYSSTHIRSYNKKSFKIYHLLLQYSDIVID
jgi:hypothetical protein